MSTSGIETIVFRIPDFENRTDEPGRFVWPIRMQAHGYNWKIRVYPRGDEDYMQTPESMSCYLYLHGQDERIVTASYCFRIGNVARDEGLCSFGTDRRTTPFVLSRDFIINHCLEVDGSLVVECDIRIVDDKKLVWYPKKLVQNNTLVKMYNDPSDSNVTFEVEKTTYQVHKCVLSVTANKLFEIANGWKSDGAIRLDGSVNKEILKMMLEFMYTVKTPDIDNEDTAKELLVAADLYEYVHLKLYVESVIVDKFLRPENAVDLLFFAESKHCALMKEAAMDQIATNMAFVKTTEAWSEVVKSPRLITELIENGNRVVSMLKNESDRTGEFDRMRVAVLRNKLEAENLELDGSREVLVSRLETHQNAGDAN